MRRPHVLVALAALALPVATLAQEEASPGWGWDDQQPPQQEWPQAEPGAPATGAAVDISTFHEPLASQGQWLNVGGYGQVWRPGGVAPGWRPYYYGRWEWTNEGWLWVSEEPWGWATYHYGRWAYDPGYGWLWVPGTQWAPAWVTWRYGPDQVGWAPLAPGFSVYVSSYPVALTWWTFMPCGNFVGMPVYRHAYGPREAHRFWGVTRAAPPRTAVYGHAAPAWGGPARGFVEGRIGRPVVPVRVQPVGSPGAARAPGPAGVVPVYRPEGRRPAAARPFTPAPDRRGWEGGGRAPQAPQAREPARQAPQPQQRPPAGWPRPEGAGPGHAPAIPQGGPAAPRYAPRPTGGEHGGGWRPGGEAVPRAPAAPRPQEQGRGQSQSQGRAQGEGQGGGEGHRERGR